MIRNLATLALAAVLLVAPGAASARTADGKLKVGFALLWTIDDQGWTTAHYNAIQYLKKQLGDKIEVVYQEKVLGADAERVIRGFAEDDCDLIFGTTFDHMDPMLRVAKDYPDIKFENCSGYKLAPNMGNYFGRMYQAEYLAGYMAGLMGYKNVGTVSTHPLPETVRGVNAFTIGLEKGLKESGAKYDPAKVDTVVWLKSWRDAMNETTLAETLAGSGHDLIRQMADTPDSSIAACNAGVPAIGYGNDAASAGADCALVSTVFNWGPYYVRTVRSVLDGSWKSEAFWGGFENNAVDLASMSEKVPADVRAKVMAEMKKLRAGRDAVFAGPLHDQSGTVLYDGKQPTDLELLQMQVLVQGVSGSLPK